VRNNLLALLLISAAAPAAQQTFRTTANTIAVEATVVDKSGKPVTDLTAADFQIFEDGKPQAVQTIYLVTAPPSGTATTISSSAEPPATPLRVETRNRVMVFVFDLEHLSADGYKKSRTAVESFLKDGGLPSDMIGILSGSAMLDNKIERDRAALLKAMQKMKGPTLARYTELRSWPRLIDDAEALAVARNSTRVVDNAVQRACAERPDDCAVVGRDWVLQLIEAKAREFTAKASRDAQLSLAVLATVANGLGRFPGRKQVVVLSDGFLTAEFQSQLNAIIQVAARNDVRFSTIDSRGLNRDPRSQSFMNEQPLTMLGDHAILSADDNADVMNNLANETGGEFLSNRNDLRPALDIIASMSGNYYVLGYAPEKTMDGSYRKIDVKVTRPGLTVMARRGYMALAAK